MLTMNEHPASTFHSRPPGAAAMAVLIVSPTFEVGHVVAASKNGKPGK